MSNFFHGRRSIAIIILFSGITGILAAPVVAQVLQDDGQPAQPTDTHTADNSATAPSNTLTTRQVTGNSGAQNADDTANPSRSSVTVNGQNIPVPENGSYNQVTENGTSRTEISVDSQQTGDSSNSSSSLHLNVTSESHSRGEP